MSRTEGRSLASEVPLVAVHLAVVAGFARVYDDGSFAGPLVGLVLAAHGLAIATRRLRVPLPLTLVAALGGAVVAGSWILFPETTSWGLPTGRTWSTAADALTEARQRYPVVVAPTAVEPGFQVAAGAALWTAAWYADWTANRLRATAEAVVPAFAIFVFCAVLGSGQHQLTSSVAFVAAVLWFVAARRAEAITTEQRWLPTRTATARALRRGAAATGAVAVLAAVALGPSLPGAGSDAAVDWRGDGDGPSNRVTVSPMVELRKRLVDQSDTEVFEVRSSQAAYWRLTSLDRFDGEIWSSSGQFRDASDALAGRGDLPDGAFVQEVRIRALEAIWAPAAFEAVALRSSSSGLRWDDDSSTLIVESSEESSDGLTYSLASAPPAFDPAALRSAGPDALDGIDPRYLELPDDFPSAAAGEAQTRTAGARTRYEQARRLQDWFREDFTYSLEGTSGHSDRVLLDFLESREGYCEQFAGAYAAMARSLGLPARVAVGFTPGDVDPDDAELYRVRGRHAHAWPEVWFPDAGWVPFEPTPGRGMPGSEAHTGVAPQQAAEGGVPGPTSTTTTTTTAVPAPSDDAAPSTAPPALQPTETDGGPDLATTPDDGAGIDPRWPLLASAAVAAGIGVLVLRRRRIVAAARADLPPAERAWAEVARAMHPTIEVASPTETPVEAARRVGATHPGLAVDLVALAHLVTEERWSPDGLASEQHRMAEQLGASLLLQVAAPVASPG